MTNTMPKIVRKTSPYLRRPNANATRMMRDVTIALLPVSIFAIYSFGLSALWILLVSIGSMLLTEYVFYQIQDKLQGESFKFKNKNFTLYNFSAFTSGLIYGLTLPDQTPLWIVALSGVLGILLAKLIFGGMGQNIFNPAAVARVLVVVNFATLATYQTNIDGVAGATALSFTNQNLFSIEVLQHYTLTNLFTGIGIPGSLGETSALLLLLGGLYLALRTSFEVRIPLMYIGTVFVLAFAVAIQQGLGIWYPLYHIFSGGLMFGAIYMATDPVTSPITKPARVYYGFALGFITFIIRLFGALPEGVIFSILIMNMFVTSFDYHKVTHSQFSTKRNLIFASVVVLAIVVTLVGASYVG
ncbi:MAG: RnfABCDGE type electron transport complex subunit D [Candidatus Izimaplasma sp.]|nr:RnfABCDGE type electron transport complex subunit D [Candidatus Izimaplasma bacterium]